MPERRVILLGSTGSIGTQTIDVIEHLNREHDAGRWGTRYKIVGLAAGQNADSLNEQASRLGVSELALSEGALRGARIGADSAERLVREIEADLVVAAIVGFAGLSATLAAVESGTDVALANKETLVAAGEIIVPTARRTGAALLPIDSEHSGVWQCLREMTGDRAPPFDTPERVSRVVITASGGPFRDRSPAEIARATPEEALAHPNWDMGAKVTVDCASLTNKAFELIEADWLFGLGPDRLGAVIHPQSLVHAMVEMRDGSVIAQFSEPDMRLPIQHALTHPDRAPALRQHPGIERLGSLDFEPIDPERFPAVELAFETMRRGGTFGAVFNGANEAAVRAFLDGRIPFGRIVELTMDAVSGIESGPLESIDHAHDADAEARAYVESRIGAAV